MRYSRLRLASILLSSAVTGGGSFVLLVVFTELPKESGTVATSFDNRHGRVAIRGENWGARQAVSCSGRLEIGAAVRIVDREGLTLVVSAIE